MKIKNLGNNILLLTAKDQYELCSTFVRLQEFYESPYPNIRGKIFTLEEFMDTYAEDHGGFTYFTDWSGFNIPGNIVNKFYSNLRHTFNYSKKELNLCKLIQTEHNISSDDYYVIGCIEGDYEAIIHELAHALFYLNPSYNKEISLLAEDYKKENPKRVKKLLKQGYDKDFIIDELQAYNVENNEQYKTIFNKYLKKYRINI